MPKTKEQKSVVVSELTDRLQRAKSVVFVSYEKLPVKEADQLRQNIRTIEGEYLVIKKTLLQRALQAAHYSGADVDAFAGNVAVGLSYGDHVALPKAVAEFVKKHVEQMKILGGALDHSFVDSSAIKHLATLPSREELLAKVVGTIQAPIAGFVHVLAGNLRGLLNVLNAVKESKS